MLRCAALHCYCVGTLTLPLTIPGCQGWLAGWLGSNGLALECGGDEIHIPALRAHKFKFAF